MNRLLKIFFLISFLLMISCSARNINTSGDYVIRYINLNAVYEYVYNGSNEAQEIKRKIDSLNKKKDQLENSATDGSKTELAYYKEEVIKARELEKKLKAEFHSRIKTAISNIAVRHNTDFILNSGDGVLYSRPVYDLTDEVIKELKSLNVRTSPLYK